MLRSSPAAEATTPWTPAACPREIRTRPRWTEATGCPLPGRVLQGSQGGFLQEVGLSRSQLGRARRKHIQAGEQCVRMPEREGDEHISSSLAPSWVQGEGPTAPSGHGNDSAPWESAPRNVWSCPGRVTSLAKSPSLLRHPARQAPRMGSRAYGPSLRWGPSAGPGVLAPRRAPAHPRPPVPSFPPGQARKSVLTPQHVSPPGLLLLGPGTRWAP